MGRLTPRAVALASICAGAIGCGGARSGAESDGPAARALFDRAVIAEVSGDTAAAEDLMFALASRHPDTVHGRSARARLSSSGALPASLGILAAVGIPAYMKYTRRSKTLEAEINLRKLSDSAVYYYGLDRVDTKGRSLPRQFPPSVEPTPARAHCEAGDDAGFAPRPDDWGHPTWAALNFAIEDPHNYRYSFTSAGSGAEATFVARAVGDLDCDGVHSTFEQRGWVDAEGNVVIEPLEVADELE